MTTTIQHSIRGNGAPILFIHGIPTACRLWDFVVERLQDRFTCIAVDLPGMGESPALPDGGRDPSRLADELDSLRRELGFSKWNVVGHDAGSTIAVHLCANYRHAVARLVLMSPPVFPEFRPPWFFALLRTPVLGDLAAPLIVAAIWNGGMQSIVERDDPATAEILESFRKPFRGFAGARRLAWLVRWGKPREVLGRTAGLLSRISAPTLIVHGQRDGAIPEEFAQRAAQVIPNARLLMLDTGHFLPLNVPEILANELRAFLGADIELSTESLTVVENARSA